jgi:hypothetical protein
MEIGTPRVEVAVPDSVQDSETDQVHQQPARGDNEEEPGPDRHRLLDPLDGLDHHPTRNPE